MLKIMILVTAITWLTCPDNALLMGQASKQRKQPNQSRRKSPPQAQTKAKESNVPNAPPYTIEANPSVIYTFTEVELKPLLVFNDGNYNLQLSLKSPAGFSLFGIGAVEIIITSTSDDWRYVDISKATILADGERITVSSPKRTAVTLDNNMAQEIISVYVSEKNFIALSKANRIDVWLGINKHQLPKVALDAIREFAKRIAANESSNSAAQPNNGMHPTANSAALMREIWPSRSCVRGG